MKRRQSVLLSALLAVGMIAAILLGCAPPGPAVVVATMTPGLSAPTPAAGVPTISQMTFTASRTTIQPGECATLKWNVEGSGQFWVELNGEPVSPVGQQQVCPKETTTYRLIAGTGAAFKQELKLSEIVVTMAGPGQSTPGAPSEVRIGVVYPLSGRLESWGQEALPFIQMAEADINDSSEARAAGRRFRFIVRSSETTEAGALAATKDLVEKEGIRVLVGFPMSGELAECMDYLARQHVAVVSSASTAPLPVLRQPDAVYRISPPELYLARIYARFALHLGYRKAALIYRTDGWGERYAAEFAAQFQAQGYPTALVPIEPTHPLVRDYAAEVAQLSAQVARLGADKEMVVLMAVWEGEDLNILHHAKQDATLSRVRWLAALLYPSLFTGQWPASGFDFPDARDFAFAHNMWGQEAHPPMNNLVRRLWTQAKAKLGRDPRYEHVYLYDACQIAARAVLLAGKDDGDAVAAAIPAVVQDYSPATGVIRFDANGDRDSGDLAYYGLFRGEKGWEYRYYAYYDATAERFQVLSKPEIRQIQFCPEC